MSEVQIRVLSVYAYDQQGAQMDTALFFVIAVLSLMPPCLLSSILPEGYWLRRYPFYPGGVQCWTLWLDRRIADLIRLGARS